MTLWGMAFHLERPLALLLALPWLAFWWWFAALQRRACQAVWGRADPRIRHVITVFAPKSDGRGARGGHWGRHLGRHLGGLATLGLLLILAAARPTVDAETDAVPVAGRVVLLLDASVSMYATDVDSGEEEPGEEEPGEQEQTSRFEAARRIAEELVATLDDYAFAVVTWSGEATLQLPMTADRASLEEALRVVEVHNFYRRTGSRFGNALDRAIHFAIEDRDDLQAVILSDGEQPDAGDASARDFSVPLAALAERGVAVHAVSIGSETGQARRIFDFRDVMAGKKERRVLRAFTTRRVDDDLRAIAEATAGRFMVDGPGAASLLARAIRERHADVAAERMAGRRPMAPWLLAVFLAGFLLLAASTHRPRPHLPGFDIDRLGGVGQPVGPGPPRGTGTGTFVAVLALVAIGASCQGDGPAALASRENALGNAADRLRRFDEARVHYERSIAFGVHAEIPMHNLGRTLTRQGAFSEAHDHFQRALELDPRLARAHFNDGWALFGWGDAERDPRGCDLDRTVALWRVARDRFAAAESLDDTRAGRRNARANLRAIEDAITGAEALIAAPPPECASPSGGGGEDESDGNGGGDGSNGDGSEGDENEGGDGSDGDGSDEDDGGGDDGGGDDGGGDDGGGDDGDPDDSDDPDAGGGPSPLSVGEREQIARALERIRAEARGDGTYHRRSLAEQFPAESWQSPDAEISW